MQTEAFSEAVFDTTIIGGGGEMQFTPGLRQYLHKLPECHGASLLPAPALSIWPMQTFSTAARRRRTGSSPTRSGEAILKLLSWKINCSWSINQYGLRPE